MNEQDIQDIRDLFGRPTLIPSVFKKWMVDQFALAIPSIPMSQLFGARAIERLIDVNTTSQTVSGGTETEIYSLLLPGKTIARNGRLRIEIPCTIQDAAATRQGYMRVKLGGNTIVSQPIVAQFASANPDRVGVSIWNLGSYAAQAAESFWGYRTTAAFPTVDLSVDTTLTITIQFTSGDADDIFVKKAVFATIFNPAEGDQ